MTRRRRHLAGWFGIGGLVFVAACAIDKTPGVPVDASGGADTGDAAGRGEVDAGPIGCLPWENVTGCPEGMFCETHARVCVDCVAAGSRCREDGALEVCAKPEVDVTGELLSGGFYEPGACPKKHVCVPASATSAECRPLVCEPYESRCVEAAVEACNGYGTELVVEPCQTGQICYEGQCDWVRNNVLLIFDTSGSMWSYIDRVGDPSKCLELDSPCFEPWPICDPPDDPMTQFTLSKVIFRDNIEDALGAGKANFALQRFPQAEATGSKALSCTMGYYQDLKLMTGDDESHATGPPAGADGATDWFAVHLGEVLVVPFPADNVSTNAGELAKWLDFKESISDTGVACKPNGDQCPGQCRSDNVTGLYSCYRHYNPELRAAADTPLGKSLFYAGEYFRRYVLIDGLPCEDSSDCPSSGYFCTDGVCKDPYRDCKDNIIILFTDGAETAYTGGSEFFNPVVQAKRLAVGLNCETDEDCRGGEETTCVGVVTTYTDAVCVGAGQGFPGLPVTPLDPGHEALSSPDGSPISIRTHVVTLSSLSESGYHTQNKAIARAGLGSDFKASVSDPAALRAELLELMKPEWKCQPSD